MSILNKSIIPILMQLFMPLTVPFLVHSAIPLLSLKMSNKI